MNPQRVYEAALESATARRYFDSVATALTQDRHGLLVSGGPGALTILRQGLEAALVRTPVAPAFWEVVAEDDPEEQLANALGREPSDFVPSGVASTEAAVVRDVVWVVAPTRDLPDAWVRLFHRATRYGFAPGCVLVLATPSTPPLLRDLRPDVRLMKRGFWGVFSTLDVAAICRELEEADAKSAATVWREAMVAGLSGGQPSTVCALWEAVLGSDADLIRALAADAERQGLDSASAKRLVEQRRSAISRRAELPNAEWVEAWERGAAYFTIEDGAQLTAAVLALADAQAELRKRYWRAQAPIVFPWLTSVALAVGREIEARFGQGWVRRFGKGVFAADELAEFEADRLGLEFSHLLRMLPPGVLNDRIVVVIKRGKRMRDQLAHGEPVSFHDFKQLWDAATVIGSAG